MFIPQIPNNSLTEEITEIVELCKKSKPEYGENSFIFYKPLNEEEISKWEKDNNIVLPIPLKEWLEFSNGYDILSDRLLNLNSFIINHPEINNDLVIIGATHGETLCFSKANHNIVRFNYTETRRYTDFNAFINETLIRSLKKG